MSIRKQALIVGINAYHKLIGPLQGCRYDASEIALLLGETFDFPEQSISLLFDEDATTEAIVSKLKGMISSAVPGDVLLFYFSGHGTRLPSRDDPSGKDEAIVTFNPDCEALLKGHNNLVPLFREENQQRQFIRDKEFKQILASVPTGINMTFMMDCCHSGDIYQAPFGKYRFVEPPASVNRNISLCMRRYRDQHPDDSDSDNPLRLDSQQMSRLAIRLFRGNRFDYFSTDMQLVLFAACSEMETAIERNIGGQSRGVFTNYLIESIRESSHSMSHEQLMVSIQQKMRFVPQTPRLVCAEVNKEKTLLAPFS